MATCSFPEARLFDRYSDYRLAVAQIIAAAQHELLLCEHDFSHSDLGSRAIYDALWTFFTANPAGNLRLIAFNPNYLSQHCQYFLQLTNKFNHLIKLQLAHESCHNWHQGFILADQSHAIRRHHFAWPRGEITSDAAHVAILQQQFNAIWEQSSPCSEWQRLYL
ncbi:hypothetical protein [Iodobacter sp.]|uniref:DUF7931 domain-containing protein n=1 Tax=Iodobacter sp. TaxID=1915058 RepID=UPI0025D5E428|nr:hypothetical protein [Iodobacter sp.]